VCGVQHFPNSMVGLPSCKQKWYILSIDYKRYRIPLHKDMKMEKWDLLKLLGAGEIKENDGGDEFNCDIRTFVNVTIYPQ
jgi:hypothetical protein